MKLFSSNLSHFLKGNMQRNKKTKQKKLQKTKYANFKLELGYVEVIVENGTIMAYPS